MARLLTTCDVEPERDVQLLLAPLGQRPEEVHREQHPHHRDGEVDRPLELGVFLRLRIAERQGDRRGHDDHLPAPEVDAAQQVRRHARLEQALAAVVDAGEDHVADEREDHGVGVQRAQATEAQVRSEVRLPERQLQRNQRAEQQADQTPAH
jgi:hypothetical protein